MTDEEILQEIEKRVKESENWNIYHHLTDKWGHPALMLQENCPRGDHQGVNIDIPALKDLLDIVAPYIRQ
ncbi:hypothetical protein [Lactobacillus intestinalis]|uniref:hypothetical protein n=1 Tax=Lactobacillus intestinalis TaxID=151781 RepID=UPI00266605DB|nr:hypothetical protein [Lactobacillus intestinalis]